MSRFKRWLHLFSILVIVLVAFGARQPVAQAQLNVVVVTTTRDLTGASCGADPSAPTACSLRQAIRQVNALPDGESATIEFNIPNSDPGYDGLDPSARTWTITLNSAPLNFLNQGNTLIDGNSQARYRGGNPNINGPEIFIDGINVTTAGGILLYSDNNTVLGLGIVRFQGGNPTGTAIEVAGNNNKVQGNYLGLNKYGRAALPNTGPGVWVRGNNNLIGGNSSVSTTEFNIISGNRGDGILVDGLPSNAQNNQIRGNYIGTARGGIDAVPNELNGINVRIGASGTIIGTDPTSSDAVFRNIISGNKGYGIILRDTQNNGVYGNWIGVDDTGDQTLPNGLGGIQVLGEGGITTGNNVIGGPSNFARNIIAGNDGPGVHIRGESATGVIVAHNNIGLNFSNTLPISGTEPVNSQTYGVLIDQGAYDNRIGGGDPSERNVISGNGGDGIRIIGEKTLGANSQNNKVYGNYIGTSVNGNGAIPNMGTGVLVGTLADYTTIGGESDGERNLIAYHPNHGIYVRPNLPEDPRIVTTTIGLNTIRENTGNGIRIERTNYTTMRGPDVRYNTAAGVSVNDAFKTSIGGTETQRASITGNGSHGIEATNSVSTTVIRVSTTPEDIGFPKNQGDGVHITGGQGADIFSSNIDENLGAGARVTDVIVLNFAGTGDGDRATFSRNAQEGVALTDVVSGTFEFSQVFNNRADGVRFGGSSDDVALFRNIIRSNGPQNNGTSTVPPGAFDAQCSGDARTKAGQGVSIRDSAKRIEIIRTLFGQNCGLGILRDPNGPAPSTPNQGIQPPVFVGINQDGQLRGRIQLEGDGKCEGCIVEIFRTDLNLPRGDGEGFAKLNGPEDRVTAFDEEGNFSFKITTLPKPEVQILATATDQFGNTSEFSVFTIVRSVDIEPPRTFFNAIPTQVITYYHTITNTGTVDDIFRLSFASEKGFTANDVKLLPTGNFNIAAGKTLPVTVTLVLPVGTDPRVRSGTIERTRITVSSASLASVTDSVTDTTTITTSVVISVTPPSANGETQAGKTLTYGHKITNNGNITATVTLGVNTSPNWATTLSTTTLTLRPGQSQDIAIGVTPPAAAQQNAKAVTLLNVNVPAYPSQNKVVTDTTTVVTTPRAIFYPDNTGNAFRGQLITYLHTVENRSNGTARFRLTASSSLGSTVTFVSATPGLTIDPQGNFTLTTETGQNILNLEARVRIPNNAPRGGIDTVTIQLIDTTTNTVIGSVQDKTTIVSGIGGGLQVYLPIVKKQ